MTLFDLLFLGMLFLVAAALAAALALAGAGRRGAAGRLAAAAAIGAAVYLGVVGAVARAAPARVIAAGRLRCYDDWCFGVAGAERAAAIGGARAQGGFYLVHLVLHSRALGRAQRERGDRVCLLTPAGRIAVSDAGQRAWEALHGLAPGLDAWLEPGATVATVRVFDVPAGIQPTGLTLVHPAGPGKLVIGDDDSFGHRPAIWLLGPAQVP